MHEPGREVREPGGPAAPAPAAAGGAARRRGWWIAVAALLALGGVVALALRGREQKPGQPAGGPAAAASRPVPVVVAPVVRRDVPIYLEGLGNVVANRTVTVKTQVDGRLDAVMFQEGQQVRRGQMLAQIDPRPFQIQLQQARGALARDQAQLVNARRNVERDRQLIAEKLIPEQQLDTDVSLAGQLEGAVEVDRAAIDTVRLNLDYAQIRSPIDGVTGLRQVDPGNIVHASDASGIVVITQLDPIAVLFTLPQDQLVPVMQELAGGPLEVEAYSRDGATLLGKGELKLVDNQINQTTSTIRLKALLPNPQRSLWPNQFVNARLRLTVRKDALVMPATAVQRGPSGVFVYVVGQDATVTARAVDLDTIQGSLALVARGLEAGERVVVDGQNQLRSGSKVVAREQGKPSAATTPQARDGQDRAPGGAPGNGAGARGGG